jgi:hypothetical protein
MSKYASIYLPFSSRTGDLEESIVYQGDGRVDSKATIKNYINLLQESIDVLTQIDKKIPEDNKIHIEAVNDTLMIKGIPLILDELEREELIEFYNPDVPQFQEWSAGVDPHIEEDVADNDESSVMIPLQEWSSGDQPHEDDVSNEGFDVPPLQEWAPGDQPHEDNIINEGFDVPPLQEWASGDQPPEDNESSEVPQPQEWPADVQPHEDDVSNIGFDDPRAVDDNSVLEKHPDS